MAELVDMGGPGFYQGLRGRKTGRAAPRQPVRAPRREAVYARYGLIDQGAADPNQGQLFDTSGVSRSVSDVAAERGLTPGVTTVRPSSGKGNLDLPLAAAPGFLPGLNKKQKVAALRSVGEAAQTSAAAIDAENAKKDEQLRQANPDAVIEERASESDLAQTPIRYLMDKRQSMYRSGTNQPWYSGIDPETGEHDLSIPGDSPRMILESAERMGVSPNAMTRAVATTSPRNRWLDGNPATSNVVAPNLASAEGAIGVAKSLPASASDAEIKSASIAASGRGLPAMTEKAVRQYRSAGEDVSSPISVASRLSQKVPNFEHSLKLSSPDPIARRTAAESYTVDTHDLGSVDLPEEALDKVGAYEVLAMTGARTALKNWQLPPDAQARMWMAQKSRIERPPLGELFVESSKGRLLSNPQFSTDN